MMKYIVTGYPSTNSYKCWVIISNARWNLGGVEPCAFRAENPVIDTDKVVRWWREKPLSFPELPPGPMRLNPVNGHANRGACSNEQFRPLFTFFNCVKDA
jgi:hypothetical protein